MRVVAEIESTLFYVPFSAVPHNFDLLMEKVYLLNNIYKNFVDWRNFLCSTEKMRTKFMK